MAGVNAAGQDSAAQFLQRLYNEGTGNAENITTSASASATTAIADPSIASISVLTLSGATPILRLPAPAGVGRRKVVYVVQDATGTRIASWTTVSGTIKWVGAAAPTLSTAAGKIDRVVFDSINGTDWIGTPSLNIS